MELVEKSVVMDLHAHPDISPEDPYQIRVMDREGHNFIAYEALAESGLDCVFDNMMYDKTWVQRHRDTENNRRKGVKTG
ncbi:hypothetical protein GF326_08905 [Candidatus Bathyarchaeota archaeon]|nr:hypothetical protein [Candidatus Bathyarchaeota archaeon]